MGAIEKLILIVVVSLLIWWAIDTYLIYRDYKPGEYEPHG